MRFAKDRHRAAAFAFCFMVGVGCQAGVTEPSDERIQKVRQPLTADRSLAITEQSILSAFSLERVLDQLVAQSGISGLTATQLFRQFWDTQNLASNSIAQSPYLCDDQPGQPGLNGFPWECPRVEGLQAGDDPFANFSTPHLYIPVGLFNRFDLAAADGSHCGEYRIVYAMRPGHLLARGPGRNFIIFEAVLPNPDPANGIAGCMPIAEYWAALSHEPMSESERRAMLAEFYFNGVGGFDPVVHVSHYGLVIDDRGSACSTGQIRTNQFNQTPWTMREYRLIFDCQCTPCRLTVAPTTVKSNPFGDLFSDTGPAPLSGVLHDEITAQLPSLVNSDLNAFSYEVDDAFNAAESPIFDSALVNDYMQQFANSTSVAFEGQLDANMPSGSPLSAADIISRVQALSCAGCHQYSNSEPMGDGLTWPDSLGFTHVSETASGGKFPISPALERVFLPFRMEIFEEYLRLGGAPGPAGRSCWMTIPEELVLTEEECADRDGRDGTTSLPTRTLRAMRGKWEGAILGRAAGH